MPRSSHSFVKSCHITHPYPRPRCSTALRERLDSLNTQSPPRNRLSYFAQLLSILINPRQQTLSEPATKSFVSAALADTLTVEPTSETKRRLNPFSLFTWRRKQQQQRQQQQQQVELPPSILTPTPDGRTLEPTTSEPERERELPTFSRSLQPRRHTSFVHPPTPTTHTTHTYPQTYPRPRRSRTSPPADPELRFPSSSSSTARAPPQPPHHITLPPPSSSSRHHHHQQSSIMATAATSTEHRDHHNRGDRDANKAGLRTWWQQFTAAQKMRPGAQHSPHSFPPPHSHPHTTQAQAAGQPAGAVFGRPLKDSLKHANVQISTADASGKLYVWGYIPVVVAKWCVPFPPSPPLFLLLSRSDCRCLLLAVVYS
jgi:hypothetical protein